MTKTFNGQVYGSFGTCTSCVLIPGHFSLSFKPITAGIMYCYNASSQTNSLYTQITITSWFIIWCWLLLPSFSVSMHHRVKWAWYSRALLPIMQTASKAWCKLDSFPHSQLSSLLLMIHQKRYGYRGCPCSEKLPLLTRLCYQGNQSKKSVDNSQMWFTDLSTSWRTVTMATPLPQLCPASLYKQAFLVPHFGDTPALERYKLLAPNANWECLSSLSQILSRRHCFSHIISNAIPSSLSLYIQKPLLDQDKRAGV